MEKSLNELYDLREAALRRGDASSYNAIDAVIKSVYRNMEKGK